MQVHSNRSVHADSFDTVLPKTERFFSPSRPKQKEPPSTWAILLAGVLIGGCIIGAIIPKNSSPAGGTIPAPTPNVAPTLPEVRTAEPVHVQVSSAPRAQLVHIRSIGTYGNAQMPDGRILGTTYRGELSSAASLPRTGAQLGDMWYTRADGHTWVLAPISTGSQTTGWVDP